MQRRTALPFALPVVTAMLMAGSLAPLGAHALPFLTPAVTVEYDHSAALAHRTYSWGGAQMVVPLYVGPLKAAVDKDLQAKGWQLVPSGGSATVFANDNMQGEQELDKFYSGLGAGWGTQRWGWQGLGAGWKPSYGEATFNALHTAAGHLVIDIFDTSGHQLLFRGVMDDDVSGTEKKNTKKLVGSLKQMFKKFPPKQ